MVGETKHSVGVKGAEIPAPPITVTVAVDKVEKAGAFGNQPGGAQLEGEDRLHFSAVLASATRSKVPTVRRGGLAL